MIDRRFKGNQKLGWVLVREERYGSLWAIAACDSLHHARLLRDAALAVGHEYPERLIVAMHIYCAGVLAESVRVQTAPAGAPWG